MKQKNRLKRLKTRQVDFDKIKDTKGMKRPGSFNK